MGSGHRKAPPVVRRGSRGGLAGDEGALSFRASGAVFGPGRHAVVSLPTVGALIGVVGAGDEGADRVRGDDFQVLGALPDGIGAESPVDADAPGSLIDSGVCRDANPAVRTVGHDLSGAVRGGCGGWGFGLGVHGMSSGRLVSKTTLTVCKG